MRKVFKLHFKVLGDVKSQDFQYRFINRCIYTNALLKQIVLVQLELCTFCNKEEETINHLFFECLFYQLFWREISNFLRQSNIYQETLSLKTVFVGDISKECPKIANHKLLSLGNNLYINQDIKKQSHNTMFLN